MAENVVPKSQMMPSNVEELKLKNLDTGEEYIIGENDPDFEFDTFELGVVRNENGSELIHIYPILISLS